MALAVKVQGREILPEKYFYSEIFSNTKTLLLAQLDTFQLSYRKANETF
jgi:hypothetical protein